jgi:hypothetical protein
MKRSEFKLHLSTLNDLRFFMEDGTVVPAHAHLTEAGIITRKFIDCGGQLQQTTCTNLQLWVAEDVDHRLSPDKARRIITQFEEMFEPEDHEIEIEYELSTVGRYTPVPTPHGFTLRAIHTACLAPDSCGVPNVKERKSLSNLMTPAPVCKPGGTCC